MTVRCGKYELLERLGFGGMAEAYLARLPGPSGFEKRVVIKKLLPHLANDPRMVEMFITEARVAAQVQHKNVVHVYEFDRLESGEYFLAMEYVPGTDLRRVLAKAERRGLRIPPWFSLYVLSEVLEGLSHAHELIDDHGRARPIIHRDVTPSNIFISQRGEVKLGDFGVAKDATQPSTTRHGEVKGKTAYMSPEQAKGGLLDARSDVFSAGVVLWECLVQRRLFKAQTELDTLLAITNAARVPPSHIVRDLPADLDGCVLDAIEADVNERTPTARDFAFALRQHLRATNPQAGARDVAAVLRSLDQTGLDMVPLSSVVRRTTLTPAPFPPHTSDLAADGGGTQPAEQILLDDAGMPISTPGGEDVAATFSLPPEPIAVNAMNEMRASRTFTAVAIESRAPSVRKQRWQGAIAALLFAAACGVAGAAVWRLQKRPSPSPQPPAPSAPIASAERESPEPGPPEPREPEPKRVEPPAAPAIVPEPVRIEAPPPAAPKASHAAPAPRRGSRKASARATPDVAPPPSDREPEPDAVARATSAPEPEAAEPAPSLVPDSSPDSGPARESFPDAAVAPAEGPPSSGPKKSLDRASLSATDRARYDLTAAKCSKCHSSAQVLTAVKTGKGPISGLPFEGEAISRQVIRCMRLPHSDIAKQDAKEILEFLVAARKRMK